jgi:hypothetical protein
VSHPSPLRRTKDGDFRVRIPAHLIAFREFSNLSPHPLKSAGVQMDPPWKRSTINGVLIEDIDDIFLEFCIGVTQLTLPNCGVKRDCRFSDYSFPIAANRKFIVVVRRRFGF